MNLITEPLEIKTGRLWKSFVRTGHYYGQTAILKCKSVLKGGLATLLERVNNKFLRLDSKIESESSNNTYLNIIKIFFFLNLCCCWLSVMTLKWLSCQGDSIKNPLMQLTKKNCSCEGPVKLTKLVKIGWKWPPVRQVAPNLGVLLIGIILPHRN